jgi:hypothetical protein
MIFRVVLYVIVGYFIYRVIQVAGRLASPGKRRDDGGGPAPPPDPHIPDFKDIKDADFIDITPKDKGMDSPKGS